MIIPLCAEKREIEFYCRKCKKSLKISYVITGDIMAPAMTGTLIRCQTHKCTRVVTLMNYTEGQVKALADAKGKCYL